MSSQRRQQEGRLSFLEEAQLRAQQQRQAEQPTETPPQRQQRQRERHPLYPATPSPANAAEDARQAWRKHGSQALSQVSEEKRRPQSSQDVVVRIVTAETRVDLSGAHYTTFVISVLFPGFSQSILLEHRYSDFAKLNALLKKNSVKLETSFPNKHWAGRLGQWTPSLALAPSHHEDLVNYRKIQLDLWLVDLVGCYNRKMLPTEVHVQLEEFLSTELKAPCDRDNGLDSVATIQNSLKLMNPLSFTLGSAIRQATHMVQLMCRDGWNESDQSIPLDLLHHAQGLCFLTVFKAGLVVSGKMGTGLLVAKKPDGSWSAPCALGTLGIGYGVQVGGDLTLYLVVLTTKQAVESLGKSSRLTFGAEMGLSIGPVGRGAQLSSSAKLQPAYAYAHSRGLFVGISLEGSVVTTRSDINAKFYGRKVEVQELLHYMPLPKAAEPLYDALEVAIEKDIPSKGLRPSQMWNGCTNNGNGTSPSVSSLPVSYQENSHIIINGVPVKAGQGYGKLLSIQGEGPSPSLDKITKTDFDQSSLFNFDSPS
jgi:lipid-binding SYLF domain-containing protein